MHICQQMSSDAETTKILAKTINDMIQLHYIINCLSQNFSGLCINENTNRLRGALQTEIGLSLLPTRVHPVLNTL